MTDRTKFIYEEISKLFPDAHCELKYHSPLDLMVAVMLSAQTTDNAVNKVTDKLFQKYHTFKDYYDADLTDLENDIRHLGLYKNKAKNIQNMTYLVETKHGGVFPKDLTALTELPGVGRKTANVFLSEWYHVPRIAVDTHVSRVSYRLKLSKKDATVLQIEESLMKKFPKKYWTEMHHKLIFFGRYFCKAQKPSCEKCPFVEICRTPFLR